MVNQHRSLSILTRDKNNVLRLLLLCCRRSSWIALNINIITVRIAAKRQTAGFKFTHRPKIRFFAPQGRLVAPIQVKLCTADGHLGPLGCAKFHLNRCRRVGMRPQSIKNLHFLVESPCRGEPLDGFLKFLGALYALLSNITFSNLIRFTGYGVIAEKPRVGGQLGRIFPCTLKENYTLDQK